MPEKNLYLILLYPANFCLITANNNLSRSGYFTVKLLGIKYHFYIECLFFAAEFKIGRHSPRVPARSVSPEGHHSLGNLSAVGTCDDNSGVNLFII